MDVPKSTFNIKPLKKIEKSKSVVLSRKEEMKGIYFDFNDSSEGSSKYSQDLPHESLSWEQNSDSHSEDENEQAHLISSVLKVNPYYLKRIRETIVILFNAGFSECKVLKRLVAYLLQLSIVPTVIYGRKELLKGNLDLPRNNIKLNSTKMNLKGCWFSKISTT